MQVYKASRLTLIIILPFVGFVGLVSLVLFIGVITAPGAQLIAKVFLFTWLGLWAYGCYNTLWKMPVEIRWVDGKALEFRSLMSDIQIPVEDIVSIKSARYPGQRFVTLRYSGGKLSLALIQGTTEFEEFLDKVSAANPRLEIWVPKFCWNPSEK